MSVFDYAERLSNELLEIAVDLGHLSTLTDKEVYEGISDIVHRLSYLAGVKPVEEGE